MLIIKNKTFKVAVLSLGLMGMAAMVGHALANPVFLRKYTADGNGGVATVPYESPTITAFTAPANGTYSTTPLVFTATFSQPVIANFTLGNAPRLALTVGSTARFAIWSEASGVSTTTASFSYTPQAGDSDADGIAFAATSIQLPSGTTLLDASQTVVNPGFSSLAPNLSGVLVDRNPPVIASVTVPSAIYNTAVSQAIPFTMTFSKPVTITGTPRLSLTIDQTPSGSASRFAECAPVTNATSTICAYATQSSDSDINGIGVSATLDLNGATILDSQTQALSPLTFTTPANLATVLIERLPVISSVTVPSGFYNTSTAQAVVFTVTFNKAVTITGTPRLSLTIDQTPSGTAARFANCAPVTAALTTTCSYASQTNDSDVDGITLSSTLDLNGGTIRDSLLQSLSPLTFTLPNNLDAVILDKAPAITSVTVPSGNYNPGVPQTIPFTVTFNKPVTITGSPRLSLTIDQTPSGTATRFATCATISNANTATCSYTTQSSDSDSNGITLSSTLDLNGGTIRDALSQSLSPLTFTLPNNLASVTTSTLFSWWRVNFTDNYTTGFANLMISELEMFDASGAELVPIDPAVTTGFNLGQPSQANDNSRCVVNNGPATSGALPASIVYKFYDVANVSRLLIASATAANGYNPWKSFTLQRSTASATGPWTTVQSFTNVPRLAFASVGEYDVATGTSANPRVLSVPSGCGSTEIIDMVGVTVPANGTYGTYGAAGNNLDFTVSWAGAVTVTGTPSIQLTVGSTTRQATYLSGSGSNNITFRYTTQSGDLDTDGITFNSSVIQLNGGSMTVLGGSSAAPLTLVSTPSMASVRVDSLAPVITSVTAPANGNFNAGNNLNFTVNFNRAVTPTFTSGNEPRLALTVGSTTRYATWVGSSGAALTNPTFRYTVQTGESDADGIAFASTSIDLPSGTTLRDVNSTNVALSFTGLAPSLSGIIIPVITPTFTVSVPSGAYDSVNSTTVPFTVTFSHAVTITGNPTISFTVDQSPSGTATRSATCNNVSAQTTTICNYASQSTDNDTNGITMSSPSLSGGTIESSTGTEPASRNFTAPANLNAVFIRPVTEARWWRVVITDYYPGIYAGYPMGITELEMFVAAGTEPSVSAVTTGANLVNGSGGGFNSSGVGAALTDNTRCSTNNGAFYTPNTPGTNNPISTTGTTITYEYAAAQTITKIRMASSSSENGVGWWKSFRIEKSTTSATTGFSTVATFTDVPSVGQSKSAEYDFTNPSSVVITPSTGGTTCP